ncbi:MAG: hypothetical protein HY869_03715 [Chloroflexi bacterium]|nr:hypothetical protein [Chloroflexota bacterium]
MYQPNFEYVVELHRREILREAEQAQRTGIHPSLFTRAMVDLANWMIATGKQLRRRYEIPAAARSSFAHIGHGMRT